MGPPSPPAAGVHSSSRATVSSRWGPIPPRGPKQGPAGWGYRAGVTDHRASAFLPDCAAPTSLPPSSSTHCAGELASTAFLSSCKGQWGCCSRARQAVLKRHPSFSCLARPSPHGTTAPQPCCDHLGGAAGAPTSPGQMKVVRESPQAACTGSTQTWGVGSETPGGCLQAPPWPGKAATMGRGSS